MMGLSVFTSLLLLGLVGQVVSQLPVVEPMAEPEVLLISSFEALGTKYALNAKLPDNYSLCGGEVTGWEVALEQYYVRAFDRFKEVPTRGGFFNGTTGHLIAPITGIYYVSAFARCETQPCDLTIQARFRRQAGFGDDLVAELEGRDNAQFGPFWTSRGVDTIVYMETGDVLEIVHESNGPGPIGNGAGVGSCIYDTSFHYGQLNVMLLLPSEDQVTTTTTPTTTTTEAGR